MVCMQIDYIVSNGWTPCLEFSDADQAYVKSTNTIRFNNMSPGYYDNRYSLLSSPDICALDLSVPNVVRMIICCAKFLLIDLPKICSLRADHGTGLLHQVFSQMFLWM